MSNFHISPNWYHLSRVRIYFSAFASILPDFDIYDYLSLYIFLVSRSSSISIELALFRHTRMSTIKEVPYSSVVP